MKVNFENHYNCCVTLCNEDDGLYDAPAPFEDINAALAYSRIGDEELTEEAIGQMRRDVTALEREIRLNMEAK